MAKHDWFDWDEFAEAAARALWSDAWISAVEELAESGGPEGRKAYREIAPSPGGSWDPLVPDPIPDAALKRGEKFASEVRNKINASDLKKAYAAMDDNADLMGWYAAMQSIGHGVGWGDYGAHNALPKIALDNWDLMSLAEDNVDNEIERAGLDVSTIREYQDAHR